MPTLTPIKVAVIDSGHRLRTIRSSAAGSSRDARSSAGRGSRTSDGHGTFVAGEIAANPDNGLGIAGIAFNAKLLIAKVVEPDSAPSR